MIYYPIFLDLRDCPVLVVGGGRVALRKVRGLLEAGARVRVVAPDFIGDFATLPVRLVRRRFRATEIADARLVFAATDDRAVNQRVGELARRKGVWANIADSAEECDFIVPARIRRGSVQIAISTGGVDPRLAAGLRAKLDGILPASD